ncbi:anaerobic glycerol-3-phosphate dehydrogenase subunit A [uncultured Alistipes sp.]|uniref:anaerobic glycerol-3-phosphate dehydrogenase subunit A n=1 Tax=uncultured Alistipes sp. TaxID=538949 RepID=UPI0026670CA4|nr:anaerobic glycerol-3-phosphate dehydrogenase subunit A [uncultured Alistipes sp.]
MEAKEQREYDVIVIGGGATGAGTARDCALRGLRVLLVERFDFASGATGRNHGLLHSGARYAVTDRESAAECIRENMILRRIARHCVEPTDGLFITLPEDDLNYQATFVRACREAGIGAEIIDPALARRMEPSVNPAIIGAVRVPDGAVDPFRLTLANVIDAQAHGARILTYHEVLGLIREQGRVTGIRVLDRKSGTKHEYRAPLTVNAGGIWGHGIARMADITINMFPAKGSLLIFGHRVNRIVLNRCRKPANADILVPGDTISLIGTTSSHVGFDEVDDMRVTPDEVDLLLEEGCKLAPSLASTRILRAYAGVRPLVASDDDPTGRNISRGIVLLDHETRDGVPGLITITGGKLMTYRLMAEWTTDLVCRKLRIDKVCTTADRPLPGSREAGQPASRPRKSAFQRHGELASHIASADNGDNSLVCECEDVSVGEVNYALGELNVTDLIDLRRRTRVGMGTCQGELCACRAAGLLAGAHNCAKEAKRDLAALLSERWKGIYPVAWGDTLRESEFTQWVYAGVCDMHLTEEEAS